jgi:hypothetical protein
VASRFSSRNERFPLKRNAFSDGKIPSAEMKNALEIVTKQAFAIHFESDKFIAANHSFIAMMIVIL